MTTAYVIRIKGNEQSEEVATRCVIAARAQGLHVERFDAITPKDDPIQIAKDRKIPISGFQEVYSRFENCLSAFLSHHTLWQMCLKSKDEFVIFEHDAVLLSPIPTVPYVHIMNIGAPSYGKFKTPPNLGVNKLVSKNYFPGAHAYMLKPAGASQLIERSKIDPFPTDIFLHNSRFPFLKEYYPWPAEARDTFTTIQKTEGCLAKHNYNEKYKII